MTGVSPVDAMVGQFAMPGFQLCHRDAGAAAHDDKDIPAVRKDLDLVVDHGKRCSTRRLDKHAVVRPEVQARSNGVVIADNDTVYSA